MRRVAGRSLMVSLFAIASAIVALIAVWPAGLDRRTEDHNGDGRPDVWRVYNRHGQIATVAVDTNFDGRSDVQEYYEGGALVRRESDRDFNDQVDLVQEFDAETRQSVRSVSDVDFDGSADLLVLFAGGRPVYSRWKTNDNQAPVDHATDHPTFARHTADDRLRAFQDPFAGDLAVRAVQLHPGPDDYLGTVQSGGLPQAGRALFVFDFAPRFADSTLPLPSPITVVAHSPRGPPSPLRS